jgi:paraquat-inducible protein A
MECHDCGYFHDVPPLTRGAVARCVRCSAVLRRFRRNPFVIPLALAAAGLLLFAIISLTPFMQVEVYGRKGSAKFVTGAMALDRYGLWELTLLVLVTTIVAPVARLTCNLAVLIGLHMPRPPLLLTPIYRWSRHLRTWSMIEVYLLGVLVAYTKLGDLATVRIGGAVYALGVLMLVMAAAEAAGDRHAVWEALAARGLAADPPRLAAGLPDPAPGTRLIGCPSCALVWRAVPGEHCPRCDARLNPRRPDSINRSWALLGAAAVLYLPANILPVLTVVQLGQGDPSTILGGVRQLIDAHLWPLALLVFFASITVPVLKVVGMTVMLVSVRFRVVSHLRDRTLLYRIVEGIGRWSMIDVFMISILVGLVHLGFLADVRPGFGAVAFALVVILTMLAAETFDPRLMWDAAEAA